MPSLNKLAEYIHDIEHRRGRYPEQCGTPACRCPDDNSNGNTVLQVSIDELNCAMGAIDAEDATAAGNENVIEAFIALLDYAAANGIDLEGSASAWCTKAECELREWAKP